MRDEETEAARPNKGGIMVSAIEGHGEAVEFWFVECRNPTAAKRFLT
jgi:transposase-like protein